MEPSLRLCPGCKLEMPISGKVYDGDFNSSPECWSVFEEVLASEFQNVVLFGQVHQLTVDSYAVQHAGGRHRDKSVCVHLVGLYLALERNITSVDVPPYLQRLGSTVTSWPHLPPPVDRGSLTIFDVAMAESSQLHALRVRQWAAQLWSAWSPHHEEVAKLAGKCFTVK